MSTVTHIKEAGQIGPLHVMLALPTYSGSVPVQVVGSLWGAATALRTAGITAEFYAESENCHVDDTRNSIVRAFMASEAHKLVFLDFDVEWRPDELVRLCQLDRPVVAGVYPKKLDQPEYPVRFLGGELWTDADGLFEVEGAPTGFMAIRRDVLAALMEREEARSFHGQTGDQTAARYYPIFERGVFGGQRRSGDYAFCWKAREHGFKIYVDPSMRFGHIGSKSWMGCLGDHLRKENGLESPLLHRSIARLRAGDDGDQTFADLFTAWGNHYAIMSDHLMAAYRMAALADGPILETGSGISTLVMGIGAERSGQVVHSLEHDLEWYQRTRNALDAFGITSVRLHYAPLREYDGFSWYGLPFNLPAQFAVVLLDGPQRKWGRRGLFRVLGKHIERARWLIDDCNDPKELALVHEHAQNHDVHVLGTDGGRKFAIAMPKAA